MKKKILIYGITGQDGSYCANLFLKKKFVVHGISRKYKNWDKNLKFLNISNKVRVPLFTQQAYGFSSFYISSISLGVSHQFFQSKLQLLENNSKFDSFLF